MSFFPACTDYAFLFFFFLPFISITLFGLGDSQCWCVCCQWNMDKTYDSHHIPEKHLNGILTCTCVWCYMCHVVSLQQLRCFFSLLHIL